jgi:hypothetical protein
MCPPISTGYPELNSQAPSALQACNLVCTQLLKVKAERKSNSKNKNSEIQFEGLSDKTKQK